MSADRLSGAVWLAVGLLLMYGAWQLEIGTLREPGSGLFPVWCGGVISALALGIIVHDALRRSADRQAMRALWSEVPGRELGLLIVALGAYVLAFVPVGFQVSTLVFMTVLFRILGVRRWLVASGASAATVAVSWVVFRLWLKVQLPAGILALG